MRRLLIALCMIVMAAGAVVAGENELVFSGSYVRHENGDSEWQAGGEVGFAFHGLLIGPQFGIREGEGQVNDRLLAGLLAEYNIGDKDDFCLFVGGDALYDYDAEDGAEDYQAAARAGVKKFWQRAMFKGQARYVLDGFGENGDIDVTAGFGWRF